MRSRLAGFPYVPTALCLTLAAVAAWQLGLPSERLPAPAVPAATARQPARFAPPPPPGEAAHAAILARPLFTPGRRPPTAGAAAVALPPVGLTAGAAGLGPGYASALLRADGRPRLLKVSPGDDAAGWRVVGIDAMSVTVERPGERRTLPLRPWKLAGSPPPAAPPTAVVGAAETGNAAPSSDTSGQNGLEERIRRLLKQGQDAEAL